MASKLYGVNATIIIFVFVLYNLVFCCICIVCVLLYCIVFCSVVFVVGLQALLFFIPFYLIFIV